MRKQGLVAYSHFKRGEPRIAEMLDSAEWIGVPIIVVGELCAGFEQGSNRSDNGEDSIMVRRGLVADEALSEGLAGD